MGLISRLYNFTAGTPAVADQVDSEFDQILGVLNGSIDSTNLAASLQQALVPVGTVLPTARATAPTGYLLCDGAAVSRTTYATLFSTIGTAYGTGDGSTTFNLPDLRGRVPVGVDGAAGRLSSNDALGNASGEQAHLLSTSEIPAHTHGNGVYVSDDRSSLDGNTLATANAASGRFRSTGAIDDNAAGGGGSHYNMQPYQVVNYMVKT